jgi:hypothetical protein
MSELPFLVYMGFKQKGYNKMIQKVTYTTRDFYLSAYLIAVGDELQTYRKDTGNLTSFVFHNSEELQQHVRKFYALEALVNPLAYGNALRNLKSMIHTKPNDIYVEQLNRTK